MRPFFPFYGSKWNISRHYPRPSHGLVIEPFCGSAGYSLFYDCPIVDLYDDDPIIAGLWNYLLKTTSERILELPELMTVGDSVDNYDICQEEKWLIGFWLNRGSAMPKKTRTAFSSLSLSWGSRAKQRIASQLNGISGWSIQGGSYELSRNVEATWFIDPPYVDKGKFYRKKFDRHIELGKWAMERKGQVIACEGPGATWLPFEPLGTFKTTKGTSKEFIFTTSNQ